MPHQLRDADLDVTVEKNQRDQEKGRGRSSTAEQPDLSAQGALALLWCGRAHCTGVGAAQARWDSKRGRGLRLSGKIGGFHN